MGLRIVFSGNIPCLGNPTFPRLTQSVELHEQIQKRRNLQLKSRLSRGLITPMLHRPIDVHLSSRQGPRRFPRGMIRDYLTSAANMYARLGT